MQSVLQATACSRRQCQHNCKAAPPDLLEEPEQDSLQQAKLSDQHGILQIYAELGIVKRLPLDPRRAGKRLHLY